MTLKNQVLSLLEGSVVSRIRFRFPIRSGEVTITRQTFHAVARAIRSNSAYVARPTDLPANYGAQYNIAARTRADGTAVRANTLEVTSAMGRTFESYIVHESLHASYDLRRTGFDATSEEASGYVAAALYNRMTGHAKPLWASGAIWSSANQVAQTLLVQYQRGDPGVPAVGADEWRTLRVSVALHPVYLPLESGLTGLLFGTQYSHDG